MGLGEDALREAERDLGSANDYGLPGLFCARALAVWVERAASRTHKCNPHVISDSALETMARFQARGWWIPAMRARRRASLVIPGMIAIWQRGELGSKHGHAGIVERPVGEGDWFGTIEANAGGPVARFWRHLAGPTLLGFGTFEAPAVQPGFGGFGPLALSLLFFALKGKRKRR